MYHKFWLLVSSSCHNNWTSWEWHKVQHENWDSLTTIYHYNLLASHPNKFPILKFQRFFKKHAAPMHISYRILNYYFYSCISSKELNSKIMKKKKTEIKSLKSVHTFWLENWVPFSSIINLENTSKKCRFGIAEKNIVERGTDQKD